MRQRRSYWSVSAWRARPPVLSGVPFPVSAFTGTFAFTGNGASYGAQPNRDGNVIAFTTEASNLTTADVNGVADAVVRDMLTGSIVSVSVATDGTPGNLASFVTDMSGDGRFAGTTTRVDVATGGTQANGLGGSYVGRGRVSDDGRVVAFDSVATNLVAGDTNGVADVFQRGLVTGTTTRVSVGPAGEQLAGSSLVGGVSNDGSVVLYVVMPSFFSSGIGYVRDIGGATTKVTVRSAPTVVSPTTIAVPPDPEMPVTPIQLVDMAPQVALAGGGRAVVWTTSAWEPGDTNNETDVYHRVRIIIGGADTECGHLDAERAPGLDLEDHLRRRSVEHGGGHHRREQQPPR